MRLAAAYCLLCLVAVEAIFGGPRPCEVAGPRVTVELVPPAPAEATAGQLAAGTFFLDPFGDVRQVVAPRAPIDQGQRPNHVLWGIGQAPALADGVYTVRPDGVLEVIPSDTWARPVLDARLHVRAVCPPPAPPTDPP